MRILFFIHSLSMGGAERATATLARHWAQGGDEVTIVTVTGPETADFYPLPETVGRRHLGLEGTGGMLNRLTGPVRRVRALRRLLRQERPDVAIGMMSTAAILLALAGWRLPLCRIGAERTYPPRASLNRFWRFMRKHGYGLLDVVTVQSAQGRDWLLQNTRARNVVSIGNAIALPLPRQAPALRPEAYLPATGAPRLLLCVGRLVGLKRFDSAIAAFHRLAGDFPQWRLAIIGEGPERAALTQQVAALELGERVILPGRCGDMAPWYRAADLYLLCSEFEGFPNTLLEALAHGVPAVAVDCETGPRDLLGGRRGGSLVPAGNMEAMTGALAALMGDEAARARAADEARQIAAEYSVARIAGEWRALFAGGPGTGG